MFEDLKSQTLISKPHLRAEDISQHIHIIRGRRVMMDADLADLYGVQTFRLNEAVKRNSARFPEDFMFQLTAEEYTSLISQIAISKPGRGGRRKLFRGVFDAIRALMEPPKTRRRRIGF